MANDKATLAAFGGGALVGGALGSALAKSGAPVAPGLPEAVSVLGSVATQLQEVVTRFDIAVAKLEATTEALSQQVKREMTTISLPIDFLNLGRLIQSFGLPGEAEFLLYSQIGLVPAGTQTTFVIQIPTGFVGAFIEPVYFFSDYYSEDITARVIVDETRTATPIPYYFTEPARISLGEWYVAKQSLTFTVDNETSNDIILTSQAQIVLMQTSFYDEWYRPVMRASWEAVNNLVELMGGRRR